MDKLYQSDAAFSECKVALEKKVAKRYVVNTLNYSNFQEKTIQLIFKHKKHNSIITLEVVPRPCSGDTFECAWTDPATAGKLRAYEFSHILIDDGKRLICTIPAIKNIMDTGFILSLQDDYYYEVPSVRVKHHPEKVISAEIIQHGIIFRGILLDFSGDSFRLQMRPAADISFQFINPEISVMMTLSEAGNVIYSGECAILEHSPGQQRRRYSLKPLTTHISRLRAKRYRSTRIETTFLSASYTHPVTGKTRTFKVKDISGSGISFEQFHYNSDLIPGMILPSVVIHFANFRINCMAQIVYKKIVSDDENSVCCGMAFLNMEIRDQANLAALLYQFQNTNTYVSTIVDLDRLWRFFFDSDFIYPQKYARIHERKELFKATYEKLYNKNTDIARYFIYQDKGEICAHVAMIRAYENTWLIQHHASNRLSRKAGYEVLRHVGEYINDFHSLFSTHMHYVMCYYRPDNRYPHRVFGGCAAFINNRQACSLDSFAYFNIPGKSGSAELSEFGLQVSAASNEEAGDLISFYESISGGLALNALHVDPAYEVNTLGACYKKAGLQRENQLFSISHAGILQALAVVNRSEAGLNLSNLTHCIHLFVIDQDHLSRDALFSVLSALLGYYDEMEDVPVLLYPAVYAEEHNIEIEKTYNLWVLSMNYTDSYFDYMSKLFKSRKGNE